VTTGPGHEGLAARLAGGDRLIALFAKMPCPGQIESAGRTGFDLAVLDLEHGPGGGHELEHHLRAADAAGVPALVRVPSADPVHVGAALDAGAAGVVVPHVLDPAGAEAVVAAAHYPPRGRRGFAVSTRAGGYGAAGWLEHLERAARETVVVVQIEDAEAVPHAAGICAVPGVSGVLIGAADLSMSLGRPGSPPHPEVAAAIDAVVAAATGAGVPLLAVVGSPADARAWHARGAAVAAFVSTNLIHAAFTAAVADTRAAAPAAGGREPLVLLPGMLGDATLWDDVAPALAERAAPRFARIDLDASVPDMAAGVLVTAPERFALAAHSLGAIVALEVVRQAPGRVTRLALLNASARPASDAQLASWSAMRERVEAGDFDGVVRDFAPANLPEARRDDAPLVARIAAMAAAVGPRGLLRQLSAQATRPDSRPSLGGIRARTLVLTGSEDAVCPPALQEELAAGIPGAQHVTIGGAGHMAALEDPAAVAAALEEWLA
jgi:4-hydroxy-2-oxoheptanedioate aldolase